MHFIQFQPFPLERMADSIDEQDSPYVAAILLASAQTYRRIESYPPNAEELPRLQRVIGRVRSSLDDAAYKAAFAEGERLTIEQAVERVFAPAHHQSRKYPVAHYNLKRPRRRFLLSHLLFKIFALWGEIVGTICPA